MSTRITLAMTVALLAACQSSDVSRTLGARCDDQSECDDRCLTPSPDWPGGFCTVTCDDDGDCPADSACIDEGNSGVCAFLCRDDGFCSFLGTGYQCKERDGHPDPGTKVTVCRG